MRTESRKIQKLKESLYVNIPAEIVKSLGLRVEEMINFEEKNGQIIMTREKARESTQMRNDLNGADSVDL